MSSGRLVCGPRPNDRFTAAWPLKPLPHPGGAVGNAVTERSQVSQAPEELIGCMREKGMARTISMIVRR
jgi:hypothetical protein